MANTVIKIKKSGATGNVPAVLEYGELSLNYTDKKLFFQNGPDTIKNFSADVFNTVSANSTLVLATTSDDIVTFTPNTGISITGDAGSKTIYIGVNENQITSFVKKTGDTMTGDLSVPNVIVSANSVISSNTQTTSSVAQITIDAFSKTAYRSAKYEVQVTSGSNYHVIELRVMHDGSTAYMAQYGEMYTTTPLGSFDAEIDGDNFNLLFSPENEINTIKLTRSAITI
jgi:hypothetical protein